MAWYKKNMLFKDLMSNVDESGNESESSSKNTIMSNEDEDQHDPWEFLDDDDIMFLRLLFNSMVWQVQQFDNGNPNLNIFILDDFVQVFHASPGCTCSNGSKSTHTHAINAFHQNATPQ
jgi:hypothetical protein